MQTPPNDASTDVLVRYGDHCRTTLSFNPELRPLADGIAPHIDTLIDRQTARRAARRAFTRAQARAYWEERLAEFALKRYHDAVFAGCNRSRGTPLYKLHFPDGFPILLQPRGRAQVAAMRKHIEYLGQLPEGTPRFDADAIIGDAIAPLEAAVDAVETARTALDAARSADLLARTLFVSTYVATFGAVLHHVGNTREANSYFLRLKRSATREDDETDDADTDVEPQPT